MLITTTLPLGICRSRRGGAEADEVEQVAVYGEADQLLPRAELVLAGVDSMNCVCSRSAKATSRRELSGVEPV